MTKNFRKKIGEALDYRRRLEFPALQWLVAAVTIFTFVYIILSIYIVPEGKPAMINFWETGSVTGLSAIYLALGCGFAIAANLIHFRSKGSHQLLWVLVAFGLGFLAFDELLQFHERGDRLVLEQMISKSTFDNWNDMMVIGYGVVALPIMIFLLPHLLKYRMVLGLFVTAFSFYILHTAIDTFQTEQTLMTDIFEESAKLFCNSFLALGSFMGLIGNIWNYTEVSAGEVILPAAETDRFSASPLEAKTVVDSSV